MLDSEKQSLICLFINYATCLDREKLAFWMYKSVSSISWVPEQNSGEHQLSQEVMPVKLVCIPKLRQQGQATEETDEMKQSVMFHWATNSFLIFLKFVRKKMDY